MFACAIGDYFSEKWKACMFASMTNLCLWMKQNFKDDETSRTLRDNLKKRSVLILDDVGKNKPTERVEEVLFNIVDQRYNSNLITIFTSNYANNQLWKMYDKSVISRITGESIERPMNGEDQRVPER